MAWYDTGTVNVTNGSTTVVGVGTNFIAGAQVGEGFYGPDGGLYEIQAIVSATSLTLADAYLGSNQTGQAYKIVPTQSLVAALATQVSTLISDFQGVVDEAGSGKFADGTAASAGITFTLDQDTGIFRPAANQIGFTTAGVQRALVSNTGIDVTGTVTADGLTLGDNDKAIFGASSDLQIYHDGNNSIIDEVGTGNLYLRSSNLYMQNVDSDPDEMMIAAIANGAVTLYHNGTAKISTTATGVDVTGTVTADNITATGSLSAVGKITTTGTTGAGGVNLVSSQNVTDAGQKLAFYGANRSETDQEMAYVRGLLVSNNGGAGNIQIGQLSLGTSGVERMRIDASGNVLVGTTIATPAQQSIFTGISLRTSGAVEASAASGSAARFNRLTSDGGIIDLRKDGATVGSIGTDGTHTYIVGNDPFAPSGSGLLFGINAATPVNRLGTPYDGLMNLGTADNRFKDLHLSGGVVFGTGGPAPITSNTLDDYEEGTFTVTAQPSTSGTITLSGTQNIGSYTKIGRQVTLTFKTEVASTSSPVGVFEINLPFASVSLSEQADNYHGTAALQNVPYTGDYVIAQITGGGSSVMSFLNPVAGGTWGAIDASLIGSGDDIRVTITYFTD